MVVFVCICGLVVYWKGCWYVFFIVFGGFVFGDWFCLVVLVIVGVEMVDSVDCGFGDCCCVCLCVVGCFNLLGGCFVVVDLD